MTTNRFIMFLSLIVLIVPSTIQAQLITLEDIWVKGTFNAKGVSGFNSMKNGKYYSAQDASENIIRYAFETGNVVDTLVKQRELNLKGFKYTWSQDETKLLIESQFKPLYRHSFTALIHVFDLKKRTLFQPVKEPVLLAEFSPDGSKIAYVKENNLYLFDLNSNKEIRITNDGKANHIINGTTDWVYEEEFAITKGFYWNSKGNALAYYRFDESGVQEFGMTQYGSLYPETHRFKYPKAGEANSIIKIFTYNLESGNIKQMDIGPEMDIYIPRIRWTQDPNQLCIYRMNRLQNKLELLLNNANDGTMQVMYTEDNQAYLEVPEITFLKDGKSFIINSERNGYNHLYWTDMRGRMIRQITDGTWDVDQFYGVNEKTKTVYIQSSTLHATERHVYAVSMDKGTMTLLTPLRGWNNATFNSDYSYFMLSYSTINNPPQYSLCNGSGKEVRVLEDNKSLRSRMLGYSIARADIMTVKNAQGDDLNAFMIKPNLFNPTKKYPVLMYVYGGPGHQLAVNRWMGGNYFWFQLLSAKGYIIVCVDGRGTGFKGETFKKCTYQQLGKYEIEDQIFVAQELGKQAYVDPTRIGIWGWSFGGYMASLGITKGADVFKTAIAVAPVTNWRYYDNIYTERFLRTPQENQSGYDDNSPINFVDKIKGNYLIIHGTADDNVHFQNTVEMVNAMINKGIRFDSEFYPNKNHGIGGSKTRLHLYNRMTRFILEKL